MILRNGPSGRKPTVTMLTMTIDELFCFKLPSHDINLKIMHRRSRSPRRGRRSSPAGSSLRKVDWKNEKLVKFEKNFYQECSSVQNKTSKEIKQFLADSMITIDGTDIPRPISKFKEAGFPKSVLEVIKEMKWKAPTPIQAQGWPLALSGRNVVGIAQTGSGKTASFILPAIVHIKAQPPMQSHDGPIALVLVTTRELAQQVDKVAHQFCSNSNLKCACLHGGAPRISQKRDLERYPEVVIATPGRLLDFLQSKDTNLRRCTYLVVDEADRMLDMGFEPSLRRIISQVRPDRQTLMWSATWPKQVRSLAQEFLNKYVQINVGSHDLHANHNIKQIVEVISESKKYNRLVDLLKQFGKSKTLVFVETKRKADEISDRLMDRRFAVAAMHGDKQQRERESVLNDFRRSKINTLVATDVASRGLDIIDIEYIINYDYPTHAEDYVHRIGRTGRSHNKGTAHTFFTSDNSRIARQLIEVLEEAKQKVPSKLKEIAMSRDNGMSRRREVQRWRQESGSPRRSRSRSPKRRHRSRSLSHNRRRRSYRSPDRKRKLSNSLSPSIKRKGIKRHRSSRSHSKYASSRSSSPVVLKQKIHSRSASNNGSLTLKARSKSRSYSLKKDDSSLHSGKRKEIQKSLSCSSSEKNDSRSPSHRRIRNERERSQSYEQKQKNIRKSLSHSPNRNYDIKMRSNSKKRHDSRSPVKKIQKRERSLSRSPRSDYRNKSRAHIRTKNEKSLSRSPQRKYRSSPSQRSQRDRMISSPLHNSRKNSRRRSRSRSPVKNGVDQPSMRSVIQNNRSKSRSLSSHIPEEGNKLGTPLDYKEQNVPKPNLRSPQQPVSSIEDVNGAV